MAANYFSPAEIKEFKEVFALLDRDGTGGICAEEFQAAMKSLGLNPSIEEVNDIIGEIDPNHDGHIDFNEFLELMRAPERSVTDSPTELLAAFEVFDKDKSGSVSSSELRQVLLSLGQRYSDEEIDEMIKHADLDGNGSIDYHEFVQLMAPKGGI